MSCRATVRTEGPVAVVDLFGRFTVVDASGMIRDTIRRLLDSGQRRILLNLAQVTYLDSAAGIGELVSSYTTAVKQGAEMKLLNVGKNVDFVLQITGLHSIFEIYGDETQALSSFQDVTASQWGATV